MNGRHNVVISILLASCVLLIVASVAVLLHVSGVVTLVWVNEPITTIHAETGFAYTAPTGHEELSSDKHPSRARVLENGVPLPGPANSLHDSIRHKGAGRYSFWHKDVYFSASDNSDPRSNGRRYEISYPYPIGQTTAWALYGVTLLDCVAVLAALFLLARSKGLTARALARRCRDRANFLEAPGHWLLRLKRALVNPPLGVGMAVVAAMFAISRFPFFAHYPVVGISPDSESYVSLTRVMTQGQLPLFWVRPPGYPLFILAVTAVQDRLLAIIAAQNALSLVASLCLVYAIHRVRPALSPWAGLAMAIFLGSGLQIDADTSLMSDSLYTSAVLLSFALLLIGLTGGKPAWHAASSAAMASAILIRPGGMYLVVTFALVAAFLLWNRYGRLQVVSFALPLPLMMLAMCSYNYVTLNAFTISPWGEANLAYATIALWEPDKSFPPEVNAAIMSIQAGLARDGFTREDRELLDTSWNLNQLRFTLLKVWDGRLYGKVLGLGASNSTNGLSSYLDSRSVIRQVALTAIRKHPLEYAKFVMTMMWQYYYVNVGEDIDFYNYSLRSRAAAIYGQRFYSSSGKHPEIAYVAKEYADGPPPPLVSIGGTPDNPTVTLAPTTVQSLHENIRSVFQKLFGNWLWPTLLFTALALSTLRLAISRGRHLGSFMVFIVTISVLGASLVVSLVEFSLIRYSYPTQFAYYLAPVMLPLVFVGNRPVVRGRRMGSLESSPPHNMSSVVTSVSTEEWSSAMCRPGAASDNVIEEVGGSDG